MQLFLPIGWKTLNVENFFNVASIRIEYKAFKPQRKDEKEIPPKKRKLDSLPSPELETTNNDLTELILEKPIERKRFEDQFYYFLDFLQKSYNY